MPDPKDNVFADVDASGIAPELIAYLDAVNARADMREIDRISYELLEPAPGRRLLEVGCGLGDDARELAGLVSPGGHVTAVDLSAAMIAEARRRAAPDEAERIEFATGDVTRLEFDTSSFDAARAERVLQHVAAADAAVAELARVVRPGGRVVVVDTDWATFFVEADRELARAVTDHFTARMVGPYAGRRLRGLLTGAGLVDVVVRAFVVVDTALATAREVFAQLDERVPPYAGLVPESLREEWFAALRASDAAGRFVAGVTMFVAKGRKP